MLYTYRGDYPTPIELHLLVLNSQQIDLLPLKWLVQFDVIHFLIGAHH